VTIDGPSGTGKGVLCGWLADRLGWHRLDSGALYRVVAHVALSRGVTLDKADELAKIAAGLVVSFKQDKGESRVILDDKLDISAAIRTETCGNAASQAAAHRAVRQALLERQRRFRQQRDQRVDDLADARRIGVQHGQRQGDDDAPCEELRGAHVKPVLYGLGA